MTGIGKHKTITSKTILIPAIASEKEEKLILMSEGSARGFHADEIGLAPKIKTCCESSALRAEDQ